MEQPSKDMKLLGGESAIYSEFLGNGCLHTILTERRQIIENMGHRFCIKRGGLDLQMQKINNAKKIDEREGRVFFHDTYDYLNKFCVFKIGSKLYVVSINSLHLEADGDIQVENLSDIARDHPYIEKRFRNSHPKEDILVLGGGNLFYNQETQTIYFLGTSSRCGGSCNPNDVKQAFEQAFGNNHNIRLEFYNPLP